MRYFGVLWILLAAPLWVGSAHAAIDDCAGDDLPYKTDLKGFWLACNDNIDESSGLVNQWDGLAASNDATASTDDRPDYVNEATSTLTVADGGSYCGHVQEACMEEQLASG